LLVARKLNLPLDGERVLDIGCYDGFILSNVKANIKVGIDLQTVNRFSDIQYIQDDFITHNFGDEKFDRIFAFDVLEHVENDEVFIKKLISLLSTNGVAVLSVPSKNIKVFPSFMQAWVDKKWGHIYRRGYETEELKNLIADSGDNVKMNIFFGNCPMFRFFYLSISLLWRVSSLMSKAVLKLVNSFDCRFHDGNNGFMYIIIKTESI